MTEAQIVKWRAETEAFRQRAQDRANYYIGSRRRVQGQDGKWFTGMVVAIEVRIEEIEPGISARAVYTVTVAKPCGQRVVLPDTGPRCGLPR